MRNKLYTFISIIILSTSSSAQTPLPYYTAFDDTTQQSGWQSFRKGVTTNTDWGYRSFGSYSSPNSIYHDYPVGAASTDTSIDWWVSPQFNFSGGARIDSMRVNIYLFTGLIQAVDFIGLYLLTGSPDPDLATNVTLLGNFTSLASSVGIYLETTNIPIPSTSGASYIAFKYVATNDWFEASFDNIQISALSTGIKNVSPSDVINIYPNPCTNILCMDKNISSNSVITVTDISGCIIKTIPAGEINLEKQIDVSDLPGGIYFLKTSDDISFTNYKFIKQ